MTEGVLYRRGVPTEPDVAELFKTFGVLTEGQVIPYQDVADVLNLPADSRRFYTVAREWRKSLKAQHGVSVAARRGVFTVRTPGQEVERAAKKGEGHLRGLGEVREDLARVSSERLSEQELGRRDRTLRIVSAIVTAAAAETKKLQPPQHRPVLSLTEQTRKNGTDKT